MDSLGGESGGLNSINQRAKDMKKEADDLLGKATSGMKQLESEFTMLCVNKPIIRRASYFGHPVHLSMVCL